MKKLLFLFAASALLASCSSDDDGDGPTTPTTGTLTMNIEGLEDLGSAAQYEGWLIVDGTPMAIGTFTVDANGTPSATEFTVATEMLTTATKYVLTVEPIPDPDPLPSDQKLVAGDFAAGESMAVVSTATAPAVGDFSNAAGTYFLRTPTDEAPGSMNNGNDVYGVWFGTPGMPPTPSFVLPTLPQGWVYEGWVIGDSGPISTGTFTAFDTFDSSNMFSGTENNEGPPVPGEDFFNNAPAGETFPLDVRGRTVVISVEPSPDNSPAPFQLKPLLSMVDANAATAPMAHDFGLNITASFPTGWVGR